MAAMPMVPSLPYPARMIPTAFSCWSSASETRKVSTDDRRAVGVSGLATRSTPSTIFKMALGGMTDTVLGAATVPSTALVTGMAVYSPRIAASALS